MAVIVLFASIIFISLIGYLYQKLKHRDCVSKKRLDGKNVLVTGGTAGMGVEIATELARRGARVLVAGPCAAEGEAARARIATLSANPHVRYSHLDLASLASVRRFAADVLRTQRTLDLLVNNAGVGGPLDATTRDGFNYVMQVNYFGTFLLTMLLRPLLKKTGRPGDPSRIVNVSSGLHYLGKVDIDSLSSGSKYILQTEIYANSKLCLVMFTRELAKKLRGEDMVVNSLEPGTVGTKIFDTWNSSVGFIITWLVGATCKSPWQGAQTALHVALDEEAAVVSGEYFAECRVSRAASIAYDETLSAKLWQESLRLVQFDDN